MDRDAIARAAVSRSACRMMASGSLVAQQDEGDLCHGLAIGSAGPVLLHEYRKVIEKHGFFAFLCGNHPVNAGPQAETEARRRQWAFPEPG
jgi:hypothetical protein